MHGAVVCFFFNDTAPTEIYTLPLHDALPICRTARRAGTDVDHHRARRPAHGAGGPGRPLRPRHVRAAADGGEDLLDRKSTRLNSSHANISYAVFCLKKKITLSSLRCHLSFSL